MKWRVVVRMSLNGKPEESTIIRKDVTDVLEQGRIRKRKKTTGSYEGQAYPHAVAEALRGVVNRLAEESSRSLKPAVCLDHLWIYIDRVDD